MTFNEIRDSVRRKNPLVHAITNPISINQCANATLAVGARPIMAEHPKEVKEITQTAQALFLNLGNITDVRIESIRISAKEAKLKNIPTVFDAVGVACSTLRKNFAYELLQKTQFSLIKGNYSEIYSLANSEYQSDGVDAEKNLGVKALQKSAVDLAKKHNCIILATGKVDIVTDGKKLFLLRNGCSQLSSVTGTGCMLGILCACFLSVFNNISAVLAAASYFGICGEKAQTIKGSGSFLTALTDALSTPEDNDFDIFLKMEEIEIENI